MRQDDLTIVTVAREPLDITLRFVAWHREHGADHIRLYLDDPDDPAIPHLETQDFVTIVRCTPQFWHSVKIAPDAWFTKRQNAALTHGYRATDTGWVAVLDADEMLYCQSSDPKQVLAALRPEARSVCFPTAEIVHSDIAGKHFRTAMNKAQCHALYGELAGFVKRNSGLVGHALGKSITRSGLAVSQIRQHFAVQEDGQNITDITLGRDRGCYLLHLIDNGYESWRSKLDWRMNSWGFSAPMLACLRELQQGDVDPELEFLRIYNALHRFSARQIAQLQAFGSHLSLDDDFMAPARRLFPKAFASEE